MVVFAVRALKIEAVAFAAVFSDPLDFLVLFPLDPGYHVPTFYILEFHHILYDSRGAYNRRKYNRKAARRHYQHHANRNYLATVG